MDIFGAKRIAVLEKALEIAQGQIRQLREDNRRLLCTINPHLKQALFPEEHGLCGIPVALEDGIFDTSGPYQGIARCSLSMGEKGIRFCATHSQDLDSQGRCPVTEQVLFRKHQPKQRRILGSEFCRGRDEIFDQEAKSS